MSGALHSAHMSSMALAACRLPMQALLAACCEHGSSATSATVLLVGTRLDQTKRCMQRLVLYQGYGTIRNGLTLYKTPYCDPLASTMARSQPGQAVNHVGVCRHKLQALSQ